MVTDGPTAVVLFTGIIAMTVTVGVLIYQAFECRRLLMQARQYGDLMADKAAVLTAAEKAAERGAQAPGDACGGMPPLPDMWAIPREGGAVIPGLVWVDDCATFTEQHMHDMQRWFARAHELLTALDVLVGGADPERRFGNAVPRDLQEPGAQPEGTGRQATGAPQ